MADASPTTRKTVIIGSGPVRQPPAIGREHWGCDDRSRTLNDAGLDVAHGAQVELVVRDVNELRAVRGNGDQPAPEITEALTLR